MSIEIFSQFTPNPNALKFILSVPVLNKGGIAYRDSNLCSENPLAALLLKITHVKEIFFCENFITVTQDGLEDWDALEKKVRTIITKNIAKHNPDISNVKESAKKSTPSSAEMNKINEILDQTIRPALQMDGGDVRLINFSKHVLQISYRGACGSCPSAAFGTLNAIERILKEQFDPEIKVELA